MLNKEFKFRFISKVNVIFTRKATIFFIQPDSLGLVALYVATSIPFISVVLLPSVVDSVTLVVSGFEALVAVLFASYIIWRARKVIFLRNGN